jgi:chromosome segregation ATPase
VLQSLQGDDVATIVASALSGGVIGKLIDWALARGRARAAATPALIRAGADFQQAVSEAARELLEDYRNQLGFVRERCDRLQADLDRARAELQAAREELAQAERRHGDCQAELAKLRREIEARLAAVSAAPEAG